MAVSVSILIPSKNAAPYLAQTLRSALCQTLPASEVIVVDDGSSDESCAITRSFQPYGVTLAHADGQGAASARNKAFELSSGSHVLFLDADDLIDPKHVECLAGKLSSATRHVAFSNWARFRSHPEQAEFFDRPGNQDSDPVDWIAQDWHSANPMTQSGMFLLPRSLLEERGAWDATLTLNDDFEFFARILLGCDGLRFAGGARLYYRSAIRGSLSNRCDAASAASALSSLMKGTAHLLSVEDSTRTRAASAAMLQQFEYGYFPAFPALRKAARDRVRELGGSNLVPQGPPAFHALRQIIGWRMARRVQQWNSGRRARKTR